MNRRRRRILNTVAPAAAFVVVVLWFVLANPFSSGPTQYSPEEDNPDVTRALDIEGEHVPPVRFVDVAAEAGIDFVHFRGGTRTSRLPEDMGGGAAWGDYDADGDFDLYLVDCAVTLADWSSGRWEEADANDRGNRLYENLGNGRFRDATERSGTGARILGMGASWGDLDGDGALDLVVTGFDTVLLYRNLGDGTFEEVSEFAGVRGAGFWSGAAMSDYDRDGDLDLYVCGYVQYDPEEAGRVHEATLQYKTAVPFPLNPSSFHDAPNRLFRNDGGLRFRDVAHDAGVDGEVDGRLIGKSLGAIWVDWNEDEWPDLYVANDVSNNHLFLNQQDGTFREAGAVAWVADPRGAMGLAVGDFDNDNDPDLFVSHWVAQENAMYVNLARESHLGEDGGDDGEEEALEHSAANGAGGGGSAQSDPDAESAAPSDWDPVFTDRADMLGLGQTALDYVGWGAEFFDFDLDGHLDLFVANGSTFEDASDRRRLVAMRSLLFRNQGTKEIVVQGESRLVAGGFADASSYAGDFFLEEHVARGAAACDYDGDGDLDLLISLFGEGVRLLRNENETKHHWLALRLRGTGGDPFAFGAGVHVRTPTWTRWATAGASPSYLGGSVGDIVVGLGDYAGPVEVAIDWPRGERETFEVRQVDGIALLQEGSGDPRWLSVPKPRGPLAASGSGLSGDAYTEFRRRFREATRLRVARQYTRAESLYRAASLLDPAHEDAQFYLGSVLFDQSRFDEAVVAWERLRETDPKAQKVNFMLGVAHACPLPEAPTDFELAEEYFARAFSQNKEESGVLLRRGELAIVRGHDAEAREYLEAAVGGFFSAVDGHYLLGYLQWKAGERGDALASLQRAVQYSTAEGMPAAASKNPEEAAGEMPMTEGDIEDPAVLRLADQYRVRPLAGPCFGLAARCGPDGPDAGFRDTEYEAVALRIRELQAREPSASAVVTP